MRTDKSGGPESGNGFVERDHSCMVSCLLGLRFAAISVPLTFIAYGFYGLTNAFQRHFTLEVHEVGIVRYRQIWITAAEFLQWSTLQEESETIQLSIHPEEIYLGFVYLAWKNHFCLRFLGVEPSGCLFIWRWQHFTFVDITWRLQCRCCRSKSLSSTNGMPIYCGQELAYLQSG
jgi:hypothetical protein